MKVWHLLVLIAAAAAGGWWYLRSESGFASADAGFHIAELPSLQPPGCGERCGVQRWPVKTLTDADRDLVSFDPISISVSELGSFKRPARRPQNGRVGPVETTTYSVDGVLVGWSPQDDGDVHLILADPNNPSATMVAEIPDPTCQAVCNSGFAGYFGAARAELETILNTPNPKDELIMVRVIGVGFFDHNHGQTGAAPNFVELHPVLQVELTR